VAHHRAVRVNLRSKRHCAAMAGTVDSHS
jgi:hypothetical protein